MSTVVGPRSLQIDPKLVGSGLAVKGTKLELTSPDTSNMAKNPDFEYVGVDGWAKDWTRDNENATLTSSVVMAGAKAVKLLSTGTDAAGFNSGVPFLVQPGEKFTLKLWYRSDAGAGGTLSYGIRFGKLAESPGWPDVVDATAVAAPTTTWTELTIDGTAPAAPHNYLWLTFHRGAAQTGAFYVDSVTLTRFSEAGASIPLPEQLTTDDWSAAVVASAVTSAGQPQSGVQFTFTKRPNDTTYFTIWGYLSSDGTPPSSSDFRKYTNYWNIPLSASGNTISEVLWVDKPESANATLYLIACPSNGNTFSTPRSTDPRKQVVIPFAPGAGSGAPPPGAMTSDDWSASIVDTGKTAVGQPQVEIGLTITARPTNTDYFTVWGYFGPTAPTDMSRYQDLANYPIAASGNTSVRGLWQDQHVGVARKLWMVVKPSNGKITGLPTTSDVPKSLVIPECSLVPALEGFSVSVETELRGGVMCGRYKYEWTPSTSPEYWTTNVYRIWCSDDTFVPAPGFVWEIESSQTQSPCYSGWWPLPSTPQYVLFKAQPVTKGGLENDIDPPLVGLIVDSSGGIDATKLVNTASVPVSSFGGKLDFSRLTNIENLLLSDFGDFNAANLTNVENLAINDLGGNLDLSRVTNVDSINLNTLGSFDATSLTNLGSLNIGSFGGKIESTQIGTAVIIANHFDPTAFGNGINVIGNIVQVTGDDSSNMLRNGNFEYAAPDGKPVDWICTGSVTTDTVTVLAGSRSAKLMNGATVAQGPFVVNFGEEFIVNCLSYVSASTNPDGAGLWVVFNNNRNTWTDPLRQMLGHATSLQVTTPSGYKYMWIVLQAGAVATQYFDSVLLQRKLDRNRITSVNASAIFGAIQSSQINTIVASKIDGQIQAYQIGGVNADKINGQIAADNIAGVYVSRLVGQITASNIQNLTITGDKIGPVQITADKIASVYASSLQAGTVSVEIILTSPKININGGSYSMQISQADGFKITVPNYASSQMSNGSLVFQGLGSYSGYNAQYGHLQWYTISSGYSAVGGVGSLAYMYVSDNFSTYEARMQVTSAGCSITAKNGAIIATGTDATKSYVGARRFRFHSSDRSNTDRIHINNYVNSSTGQNESTGVIYLYDENGAYFGKIPYFL